MQVIFGSRSLRRCYEDRTEATRTWGNVVGRKYIMRINILYATDRFGDLYALKSLRLHELKGDREGQYAITLHGRWRLILIPHGQDEVRVEEVTQHYGD